MKKLIKYVICVSFLFLTMSVSAQVIDYPRFETDSLGQKVIVMTIEQAQALDNKTDLIPLFEKLNVQIGSVDSACIKVINEKDMVIASQDFQISNQKSLLIIRNKEILNLQGQIVDYKNKEVTYIKEIENKDKEIKLHLDKIRKQKVNMFLGGGIGGVAIVGLVLSLLLIH
jgi:hypothetical protein